MRRIRVTPLIGLIGLGVVGCGGGEARSDIAAEAGDATLTPDLLATWIAKAPGRAPTLRDAENAATIWVDYTLLAGAVTKGQPLADATTFEAAAQADFAQWALRIWRDTLNARRPPVPEERVDSAFANPNLRLFQHVLITADNPEDDQQLAAAQARADTILRLAKAGTVSFSELARTRSRDTLTAQNGGYMPIGRRAELPPEFVRGAWPLQPGAIALVGSRVGFHVLRRPPLEEVRARFRGHAQGIANARADSVYLDSLGTAVGLTVTPAAVPAMRAYFADPASQKDHAEPLVTWQGGSLTLADLVPWINLLPPPGFLAVRGGSDVMLEAFARDMGRQRLLLDEARAAGITVPAEARAALRAIYDARLGGALGLLGVDAPGTSLSPTEATQRVERLMSGLASGELNWQPLPGALAGVLRERAGYRLHQPGLEEALSAAIKSGSPKQ